MAFPTSSRPTHPEPRVQPSIKAIIISVIISVGPGGRVERIRVVESLGPALDGATVAKVRQSYVATPMSVQSLTFSP